MKHLLTCKNKDQEVVQVDAIRLGVASDNGFTTILQTNTKDRTLEFRRYAGLVQDGCCIAPEMVRETYFILRFDKTSALDNMLIALQQLRQNICNIEVGGSKDTIRKREDLPK